MQSENEKLGDKKALLNRLVIEKAPSEASDSSQSKSPWALASICLLVGMLIGATPFALMAPKQNTLSVEGFPSDGDKRDFSQASTQTSRDFNANKTASVSPKSTELVQKPPSQMLSSMLRDTLSRA